MDLFKWMELNDVYQYYYKSFEMFFNRRERFQFLIKEEDFKESIYL